MQEELEDMLARLKLTTIRGRLDSLLEEAAKQDMTLRETLSFLCQEELIGKNSQRIKMSMKMAKFPCDRTLEQFEFDSQPTIDPKQIRELSLCRWVAHGEAVLLLGPPGVGKTHLAIALGRESILRGYSILYDP